ncbi:DoxX family protein [Spongiimicrobium sp. 2-473A-2-J]|uniref:DoxX family protein n=1 Tax=Eudoraea algarum TaxID=3417568 RepID=UPI003D36876A
MKITEFFKRNYPNTGIGLLRIGFGVMLAIVHGWPTVKGFFAGVTEYPDPLGLGSRITMGLMGFAEFFCAMLVALGLFTRITLIPLIIGFLVAVFVFHGNDPFDVKERAFHYLIVFVVLFITGPGSYVITNLFKRKF